MLNVSSCLGVIYDISLFHEPLLCAQEWLLYLKAWAQVCVGPGMGEALGFWQEFLKPHCSIPLWCSSVWFCLASLVLLAQGKSFSLPWLGKATVAIFQLPSGELKEQDWQEQGLPAPAPNLAMPNQGEKTHQEAPAQLLCLL